MIRQAGKIPVMESKSGDLINFDLLPRRGVHTSLDLKKATKYLFDNYHPIGVVNVTWLQTIESTDKPQIMPHFYFRTQGPSGTVAPRKDAVWASLDFEKYSIRVNMYDGPPSPSSLLPKARITFSDGKNQYFITGAELVDILHADKTIETKKIK